MSNVNFDKFLDQIGLSELTTKNRTALDTDFMPAALVGLSDGDFAIFHEEYTGEKADLYGTNLYNHGRVAKLVGQSALENGMTAGPIYDFQAFAAEYFKVISQQNSELYRSESTVRIYPEVVTIDGNPLLLPRLPQLIIDYGACLTGRSYIRDQLAFLGQKKRPFVYAPLTRSHFTNRSLINTYDINYGQGMAETILNGKLYIGREDGTGSATDEIIIAQQKHGASAEVADIILCTGSQHTHTEDLQRGITNAFPILKEGGMLLVRSLAKPSEVEIGTQQIVDWAIKSGFPEKSAIRYEADLESYGSLLISGHFGKREIKTVILTKE